MRARTGSAAPRPDALVAGLAGALNAPILLTAGQPFSAGGVQAIQVLNAQTVYVVGGRRRFRMRWCPPGNRRG